MSMVDEADAVNRVLRAFKAGLISINDARVSLGMEPLTETMRDRVRRIRNQQPLSACFCQCFNCEEGDHCECTYGCQLHELRRREKEGIL